MLYLLIFGFLVLFLLSLWFWYNPESLITPINFLYYTDSCPRTNFYSDSERDTIFPTGKELELIWSDIKHEGYHLYHSLNNKDLNYLNNYNIDLGEENKQHWTTIPLRLFGRDSPSYMDKCPKLSSILKAHPEIISCLFSIMKPGKIIKPHVGPYDGLIRYQLALDIPQPNNDEECYLHVGGEKYYWTEGRGVLFDEGNTHGAVNTTTKHRMVLLIDLERPYNFSPYRLLNKIVIYFMGLLPSTKQATLT
jgi:Aspartyl/asparaginyl beta-hydroxylase and related dioxygenases